MISWMQKHNKYLIVTIWIATIAFIGAGFVGWGSYQYGSKASAIGKVGDIEITQEKFDMTYQNLYNQYSEMFKGKFDKAKAKELGLPAQAFGSLASQAQLLNLAKQYGILVSDTELGAYVTSLKGFQREGKFDKVIYETYLKNRGLRTKTFEDVLRDELIVQKLMTLIDALPLPSEIDMLASTLSIADKIGYKVFTASDIVVKLDDDTLKKYWEQSKDNYMTARSYKLKVLWTDSKDTPVTEKELHDYYDKNSYTYVGADGKQFTFDQAKPMIEQDYKLKKTKKQALKEYVAFKKGERQESEVKLFVERSPALSTDLWKGILAAKVGDLLKPKIVGTKYATVKIDEIIEPSRKTFEEAKAEVTAALTIEKKNALLEHNSKELLKNIDKEKLSTTNWMTMRKFDNMIPLSQQETLQFLQKLFTSSAKNGMITVSDKVVVYKIIDQKMESVDSNLTKMVAGDVKKIKKGVFEANLFKTLNEKYPAQKFVKGI